MTLTVLVKVGCFVECFSIWICLMFFSGLDWAFRIWKSTVEIRCPSCHIMVPTWRVTGDVKHYHMVMIVFASFLHCTVIILPFLTLFFGRKLSNLVYPGRKGITFLLEEGCVCVSCWNFSVRKTGLFCPVYLFICIYWVMFFYLCGLMFVYFILWVTV